MRRKVCLNNNSDSETNRGQKLAGRNRDSSRQCMQSDVLARAKHFCLNAPQDSKEKVAVGVGSIFRVSPECPHVAVRTLQGGNLQPLLLYVSIPYGFDLSTKGDCCGVRCHNIYTIQWTCEVVNSVSIIR